MKTSVLTTFHREPEQRKILKREKMSCIYLLQWNTEQLEQLQTIEIETSLSASVVIRGQTELISITLSTSLFIWCDAHGCIIKVGVDTIFISKKTNIPFR